MNRAARAAFWTLPTLFFLWLWWGGIKCWFWQDDFAWLHLHIEAYNWRTFLKTMFEPMAQGTIRPWSERGFFLLFWRLFQADALPYRILAFATQAANLVLLGWVVLRLSGSRLSAFAAPVLWAANSVLVTPMTWTSAYNEPLCALFLLAAFSLYLKGRYWPQAVVFVLGFGALEVNIVYPAIVAAYLAIVRPPDRRLVRDVLPLAAISAAYAWIHFQFAPAPRSGAYALHWDAAMAKSFAQYWSWSFTQQKMLSFWPGIVLGGVLLVFIVREALRGRKLPLFFLAWFAVTLAPVLPLRDHVSAYYLVIPTIGLAAAAALSFSLLPVLLLWSAAYFYIQIPFDRSATTWYLDNSRAVKNLVLGVQRATELHPGKAILLSGVSLDQWYYALTHFPFRDLGISQVYIAPESIGVIPPDAPEDAAQYRLDPEPLLRALEADQIEVYSAAGTRLRNITSSYSAAAHEKIRPETPNRVDVGQPLLAYLLGSSWYSLEGNHRWMPKRASLRMGGPRKPGEMLVLTGYCPAEQVRTAPLALQISVDGNPLAKLEFSKPEMPFTRSLNLPPGVAGKSSIDLELEVDHTFGPDRPLGLAFGVFEIK